MTYPAFILLISRLVFRDRITPLKLVCLLLSFAGVVLVMRPAVIFGDETLVSDISRADPMKHTIGIAFALLASLSQACIYIYIKISKDYQIPSVTLQLYHTAINASFCILGKAAMQEISGDYTILVFMMAAGAGVIGSNAGGVIENFAFSYEPSASKLSVITYAQVPIAYIADILIFGMQMSLISFLGLLLVAVPIILLTIT